MVVKYSRREVWMSAPDVDEGIVAPDGGAEPHTGARPEPHPACGKWGVRGQVKREKNMK